MTTLSAVTVGSGVLLGLAAATFQSLSYVASRRWTLGSSGTSTLSLLSLAHVIMGFFALVLLVLLAVPAVPPLKRFVPVLAGASGYYLAGQFCLLMAIRRLSPSRVSPLLGLKIVLLAIIGTSLYGQHYSLVQYAAMGMAVAAVLLLNRIGGKIRPGSFFWIVAACTGYSLSDIHIKLLVELFAENGQGLAPLYAAAAIYLVCGLAGTLILPFLGRHTVREWTGAFWFALFWFGAMVFLFWCFDLIGVMFGNIIQSSRGILSILLGAIIIGHQQRPIEEVQPMAIFLRRGAAALLMSGAICLFSLLL